VTKNRGLEARKRLAAQIFVQLPTDRVEALIVLEMARKWMDWDGMGEIGMAAILKFTGA
jgi:hypothetical protein